MSEIKLARIHFHNYTYCDSLRYIYLLKNKNYRTHLMVFILDWIIDIKKNQ